MPWVVSGETTDYKLPVTATTRKEGVVMSKQEEQNARKLGLAADKRKLLAELKA